MLPTDWKNAILGWADESPEISAVYLFGSYAKGRARPDSDLDLGVIIAAADEHGKLGAWIDNAARWKNQLQARLPVKVHLEIADADVSEVVVAPAVIEHGVLLYRSDGERI